MPTTEISVSGRVRHIRPLPSDSTTTSVPCGTREGAVGADLDVGTDVLRDTRAALRVVATEKSDRSHVVL
ncbi:hypothetical protein ACFPES_35645 [Paenibacillus sp. GCM10023248]|nr:hypothetical protein [Paenibacillus sp. MAHUQ-63]